jgi:hypothetical protein
VEYFKFDAAVVEDVDEEKDDDDEEDPPAVIGRAGFVERSSRDWRCSSLAFRATNEPEAGRCCLITVPGVVLWYFFLI